MLSIASASRARASVASSRAWVSAALLAASAPSACSRSRVRACTFDSSVIAVSKREKALPSRSVDRSTRSISTPLIRRSFAFFGA